MDIDWVEIITLRSRANTDRQFVDELLKELSGFDSPTDTSKHPVEIRVYHHSVVETDLSIHIYWESESGIPHKSPLGLRFSAALRNLGLLNHSVWVETASLENHLLHGNSNPPDVAAAPGGKGNAAHTGRKIALKDGF
jgi:hypothetical protein